MNSNDIAGNYNDRQSVRNFKYILNLRNWYISRHKKWLYESMVIKNKINSTKALTIWKKR